MNRKFLWIALLTVLMTGKAASQVRDVTFTVSPGAEYTWWNDNLSLDNNTWIGLSGGFGFGPLFELRGFYRKSDKVGFQYNDLEGKADLSRYGGEMRLNLMQGTFLAPYLSVTGGVQKMKYALPQAGEGAEGEKLKEEQLFGALGVGTKFYLSDRASLSLEARNTFFGMDETSPMLKPEYVPEKTGEKLRNWSAAATLDFYLGGSNLDEGSVAEAYRRLLSDGFSGMKFVLEPGGVYLKFHEDLPYQNHYMLGGSAGFDFSSLVGIRGFYYRTTKEPDKLTLSFGDKLSMYGGNIMARLNHPRGVSPFLQLGGGYLKAEDGYVAKEGMVVTKGKPFAFGGAGLEIPLSRYVAMFGAANALVTSNPGVKEEHITEPSQVKTSMMYNAGVRFNIGRSATRGANAFYERSLGSAVEADRAAYNRELNAMRADYESRLRQLEDERFEAEERGNKIRAEQLRKEERRLKDEQRRMDEMDREVVTAGGDRVLRMSSDDLAELVAGVVDEVRRDMRYMPYYAPGTPRQGVWSEGEGVQGDDMMRLERQNEELKRRLDELSNRMDGVSAGRGGNETIILEDRGSGVVPAPIQGGYAGVHASGGRGLKWNRLGVYTGPGFGDLATWNIGVRGYMQISNSPLDFVPEFYAAMGKKSGLGLSGNVVWNIDKLSQRFTPYVGLGLGIFHGKKTHTGSNIILGSTMNLGGGALFADYSIRSLFKQNQLAVGYRFVF